jgi:hypothetical protein
MSKFLFKGLDAVTVPGPGPTLWFQSPTSFNDMACQINLTGDPSYSATVEVTLNGTDFQSVPVGFGPSAGNIQNGLTGGNGAYTHLGPIGLMMGFRLNFLGKSTGSLTVLLAIDQKD